LLTLIAIAQNKTSVRSILCYSAAMNKSVDSFDGHEAQIHEAQTRAAQAKAEEVNVAQVTGVQVKLDADIDLSSFDAFKQTFPLQGELLYTTLFERHSQSVQTQKVKFAVANLEKIFSATFAISASSGFDKMSIRDLSKQTGMSMGAIYSCIRKKEDIALMVADIVRLGSDLTRQYAMQESSYWSQIEQSIRFHLYASSVLQAWYFFLYFETRSLPEQQQNESKQIELDAIATFKHQIEAGVKTGEFQTDNASMVANTIVVLLEDWYLKPWKSRLLNHDPSSTKGSGTSEPKVEVRINNYHQSFIELVKKLLVVV
jgi:AcrR family transcriptional regulator